MKTYTVFIPQLPIRICREFYRTYDLQRKYFPPIIPSVLKIVLFPPQFFLFQKIFRVDLPVLIIIFHISFINASDHFAGISCRN